METTRSEERDSDAPSFAENDVLGAARKIRDDPVVFAKALLDVVPYPYQVDFLRDKSNRIVVCAGRQIGKSLITSIRALWFAATNRKTTTLIVSATLRQSMLMFQKISSLASDATLLKRSVSYQSKTKIRFRNGSEITALPCGKVAHGLRGYTAHLLVMDEAAYMPDDAISEVLLPTLATTQGAAIMISSPADKDHVFFKAFTSPSWSKYHLPSSVNPLITQEWLEEQRELIGEQRYAREYLGEFIDDELAYFPMALLRSCLHSCTDEEACAYCGLVSDNTSIESYSRKESTFFGGYDPGGKQDPAAFVVVEKMNDRERTLRVVQARTFQNRRKEKSPEEESNLYTRITAEVSDLARKFHVDRVAVDSTGLGLPIVELCKSLGMPTQGLALTNKSKEELLSTLRILLEQKKIVLPYDLNLLANLNCIKADRTKTGGYSFSHPSGTHDDLAYALALAVQGAVKSTKVVMMKSD